MATQPISTLSPYKYVEGLEAIYVGLKASAKVSFVFKTIEQANICAKKIDKKLKVINGAKKDLMFVAENTPLPHKDPTNPTHHKVSKDFVLTYSVKRMDPKARPMDGLFALLIQTGAAMRECFPSPTETNVPIYGFDSEKNEKGYQMRGLSVEESRKNQKFYQKIDGLKTVYFGLGTTPEVSLVFTSAEKAQEAAESIRRTAMYANALGYGKQYTDDSQTDLLELLRGGNLPPHNVDGNCVLSYSAKPSGTVGRPTLTVHELLRKLGEELILGYKGEGIRAVPLHGVAIL